MICDKSIVSSVDFNFSVLCIMYEMLWILRIKNHLFVFCILYLCFVYEPHLLSILKCARESPNAKNSVKFVGKKTVLINKS